MSHRIRPVKRTESGAFAALAFVALAPLLVAIGAFAVDSQHYQSSRAELQRACDAGALAGANALYLNATEAEARARSVTGLNIADGRPVVAPNATVAVAVAMPSNNPAQATPFLGTVTVTADMRVRSFFAQIFQNFGQDMSARAVAGPSGTVTRAAARKFFPTTVSLEVNDRDGVKLKNRKVGETFWVDYKNSGSSNAAMTAFDSHNTSSIRNRMKEYINPNLSLEPNIELYVNKNMDVSNGMHNDIMHELKGEGTTPSWINKTILIPVTDSALGPGDKNAKIVGFIAVKILAVQDSGNDKGISFQLVSAPFNGWTQNGDIAYDPNYGTFFSNALIRPAKLLQ